MMTKNQRRRAALDLRGASATALASRPRPSAIRPALERLGVFVGAGVGVSVGRLVGVGVGVSVGAGVAGGVEVGVSVGRLVGVGVGVSVGGAPKSWPWMLAEEASVPPEPKLSQATTKLPSASSATEGMDCWALV